MMARILILFILLFSTEAAAQDWTIIQPGLKYKKVNLNASEVGLETPSDIHVFRLDPSRFQVKPILLKDKKPTSIQKLVEQSGALIGVNANFFDENGKPLGLVLQDRTVLNPFRPISWWGVFMMKKNVARILHSQEYGDDPANLHAVQAGPRLVINGLMPKLKPGISSRTAIGIARNGDIIIVCTRKPIDIKEFAGLLAKPEWLGGLGCIQALNLDGGSSTQMYALIDSFKLSLPSYIQVPIGLGVFKKK